MKNATGQHRSHNPKIQNSIKVKWPGCGCNVGLGRPPTTAIDAASNYRKGFRTQEFSFSSPSAGYIGSHSAFQ